LPAPNAQTTLISFNGLRERLGLELSRTTIWRMTADGRLPKPVKTSATRSGRLFWRLDEVEAALVRWPNSAAAHEPEVTA
jgi:predicted DNA-binding transcriptional regulator AlpA